MSPSAVEKQPTATKVFTGGAAPAVQPNDELPNLSMADAYLRRPDPKPAVPGDQSETLHGVEVRGTGVSPTTMNAGQGVVAALAGGNERVARRLERADTKFDMVPSGDKITDLADYAHLYGA